MTANWEKTGTNDGVLTFEISEEICRKLGRELKKEFREVEIGYLAMHMREYFQMS